MNPLILLRLEGAAVFVLSIWAYRQQGGGWLTFALLFLTPDISMLGYLANPKLGAALYNSIHTYIGPVALAAIALATGHSLLLHLALIWTAHIGFDRMLGFGLKYPTGFQNTHLNVEPSFSPAAARPFSTSDT